MAPRDTRADGTVTFLPHRLNRQPTVVRGLTADELWLVVALSGGCGLAAGLFAVTLVPRLAIVPTVMVGCMALGVFAGGNLLRAKKRGRPDTWLPRQLQWWIAYHLPALARYLDIELITRGGYWTTRRVQP